MPLCSAAEVKDALGQLNGHTLPAGATDPKLEELIAQQEAFVLEAYGASAASDLTANKQVVAKSACLQLSAAKALLRFFPRSEAVVRQSNEMRKAAMEEIDRSIVQKAGASPSRSRLGAGLL
jgi:hypothetical protein